MSATPIHPGKLYRVRGFGHDMQVIAPNGCSALQMLIRLEMMRRGEA